MISAFERGTDELLVFDYLEMQRQGEDVEPINAKFLQAVEDLKPDFIHLQLQETNVFRGETLRKARSLVPGVVITQWNGDVRVRLSAYHREVAPAIDLTLIASTGQFSMFEEAGARRVAYWQVGFDPERNIPTQEQIDRWRAERGIENVVFLANHYGRSFPGSSDRYNLGVAMRGAFGDRFGLYGSGWPIGLNPRSCPLQDQGVVMGGAVVSLGMNHFRGLPRYYSDRTAFAIAAGTCHLTDYVPGIEAEYEIGKEIEVFKTIEGAVKKTRALLDDPERAKAIGLAGQRRALAEHTWDHRVQQYLTMIRELRPATTRS